MTHVTRTTRRTPPKCAIKEHIKNLIVTHRRCLPNFFSPQILFLTQNFFWPKFCSDLKKISDQNIFFGPTIFLDTQFFQTQNFFGTQQIFRPNIFWEPLNFFAPSIWIESDPIFFFGPKNLFCIQNFLDKIFFRTQHSFLC